MVCFLKTDIWRWRNTAVSTTILYLAVCAMKEVSMRGRSVGTCFLFFIDKEQTDIAAVSTHSGVN